MKITAFHIKNYRSIVDSGKCFLSPDYITALIGQNESGKTSVLEALRSFYEGHITDDVLRSDLTFPEIACTFQLDAPKTLGDYLNQSGLPESLHTVFSKTQVTLKRSWVDSQNSLVTLAEPEITDFYDSIESEKAKAVNKIIDSIPDWMKLTEAASREIQTSENAVSETRNELNTIHTRFEELQHIIEKSKSPDAQITTQQELEQIQKRLTEAETRLKEKLSWLEDRKSIMQQLAEKLSICKSFKEISDQVHQLTGEKNTLVAKLRDVGLQYELCATEKEKRVVSKQLDKVRDAHIQVMNNLNDQMRMLDIRLKTAQKVLSGRGIKDAEYEALHEYEVENGYATPEEMGNKLFKHVPLFEFFEDFSSLLPNKIDLDDLLNENVHAEGYKAARNFLCVAGLNADFFREKNHRILKQKIENLNSEITVDFQDYWRQSVGKNDKIRIHFELEHYDNSQPEKSGKPYLEFWIKDKQERLYPKQRSRGVRWFLSFYLELKATAKENSVDRVMLIDEPGLSLHARAQEDVLKVFEDLSNNLQIIYCTHSPNLIDLNKLYRIVAVQRAKDTDEKSETLILDSSSLNEASTDTLSPIYALMGTRLNDRQFIFPQNNLIVEDMTTYHYLDMMAKISGMTNDVHFIPSSGHDQLPVMANILYGWKIDFGILLMDKPANHELVNQLKATCFYPVTEATEKKITTVNNFPYIEDLFSTIDFKRFILQQRVGITVRNSEYIESNQLSRMIMVSNFCSKLEKDNASFTDFDEETQENFTKLFNTINMMIGKG